jgi:RNA polymerase sigma-70 factor (sigma-E family)
MTGWNADERFHALVAEHADTLLRIALMLTGNRHDAEDAVQDALITVAERWNEAAPQSGLAYLKRAVSNRAIDLIRKRRDVITDDLPEVAVEDAGLLRTEDDRAFAARLVRLPLRQRATLVLRFQADLDDRSIAKILGCSVQTVRSQAHRGLATLRAAETERTRTIEGRA